MATPFHLPDEFVQGIYKSGQSLLQGHPLSAPLALAQARWLQQQTALWSGMLAAAAGKATEPVIAPDRGDRRFQAEDWRANPWYSLLKQNYLLNSRLLAEMVEAVDLDAKAKHKLRFYTRQFIDAMSPANFAATNPDALRLALETKGESVKAGLTNLLEDLQRGRVSITDETAFEVGRNVATSEGAVVFENELFQLIQYAPLTAQVASRPLLIVPPCINKFYILDLQPGNSFVRYACEQGQTVFLVSWRNPDAELARTTWDDYVELGAKRAIDTARAISGADKVNVLGWCVGGTILASTLAVLRARGDQSVASLTLLTTMLDFSDVGDLGVFIDEQGVAARERTLGQGGIYPGRELGAVFQTLRANDLIWANVVSNYLEGKAPAAFDLLYWNADATNLPGPMYAWYLRNMYLENNLRVPGRLTIGGTPVDLGRIDVPSFVLATQGDHIVPWRSAYGTTQLVGGESRFVLGASGHIAGVINPASRNRRSYWTGGPQGEDAQAWLAGATETPGSWWTHWMQWLAPQAGKPVAARRKLGNAKHKPIEPAPGRYVQVRAT
ncbi:MAG: class I poly(R)-hydroxyalkanoic acid synthase [Burkholderiales bacterium]|nr:class I poly(R)-hydroxyalkanoic acid synthase [Burkholderiales bacterium]MDE1925594.1 class I poly(R)-hydroxyalkanoic acid synthase [Burkholderiales bacterium]MDE2159554.1 class I poly(R)-hydroxyalkanoic acid synthase [Burkholderiales bacterium]MDE2503245.1 class I poly(R)-hydroxyalkanoic acid synthase [Burkholderiales bacterium]